jgi:tetratricopeptide (TPR) repeat protein
MRPGERPLAELAQVLGADPGNPAAAVAEALKSDPEAKRLLLVVDQFEEVFAPEPGKSERRKGWSEEALVDKESRDREKSEQFCRALLGLLNVESAAVVLIVRADFYAELMGTPLWPQIKANRADVGPLEEVGLREAIYRPAETVGVYVESALVERLASDAIEARSQGILPLVQEVLVQLWEKLERRVLPLRAYAEFVLPRLAYDQRLHGQKRTGLEVAIACHADGVLKQLEVANPGQVEIARRIFVRLVHFGEGRPDTRRQQSVAQLRAGNAPVAFEATLNALARNRLITLTADRETGRRRADIAHEALIRGWPRLERWIEESRKAEEIRRKLERKAQEWIEAGTGTEGLLGTGGLVEAESFLAGPDGRDLPEDDAIRRLIRESGAEIHRAEIERETARQRELDHAKQRVRILSRSAAVLGALLVGLVGVTVLALTAHRQAKKNQAEAEKQAEIAAVNQTKAEAKEAEAKESQRRAQASLRVACEGLDRLLTEVADVDLADVPQMEPVRRRLLEEAREKYENLRQHGDHEDSPLLRWVVARSNSRLGEIRETMGDYGEAEALYQLAIKQLSALLAKSSGAAFPPETPGLDEHRRDLLRSQLGLGALYRKLHRFGDAEEQLLGASKNGDSLASGAMRFDDRRILAEVAYEKGVLWAQEARELGDLPTRKSERARASEQAYLEALRLQEQLLREQPDRALLRARVVRSRNNLGKLVGAMGRLDLAESEIRAAVALVGESPTLPGERWQVARAKNNLGTLLAGKKPRANEGLGLLREARDQLERLTKEFPTVPQYQQELASIFWNLGLAEKDGQRTLALQDLKRALEIRKKLVELAPGFPAHRMDLAVVANEVAYILAASDPAGALAIAHEGLASVTKLGDHQPPIPSYVDALGRAHYEVAHLFMLINKRADARAAIEQSVRYHRQALDLRAENGQYRAHLFAAVSVSSRILLELGDTAMAAKAAEELPRLLPEDVASYYRAATFLTMCQTASKDEGQDYGRRAVSVLQKAAENGLIKEAKQLNFKEFRELRERDDFRRLRDSLATTRAG